MSYENLGKKLLDKYKVFEGNFESITYYWGGDYEGKTYREMIDKIICRVSESEIVGKLRWFLRTVFARFNANDLNSYEEVDDMINFLGYTKDKKAEKSHYIFRVSNVTCEKLGEKEENQNVTDNELSDKEKRLFDPNNKNALGRAKLMLRNKSEKYYPVKNVRFKLEILRRVSDNKYDFLVVGGTLLTLAYIGIGKAATRGYGRFYPDNVPSDSTYKDLIDKITKGEVKEAFKIYYDTLKEQKKLNKDNDWKKSKIPLAPLDNEIIQVLCKGNLDSVLSIIDRAVQKVSYKGNITDCGKDIHTWVFGLPRQGKLIVEPPKSLPAIKRKNILQNNLKSFENEVIEYLKKHINNGNVINDVRKQLDNIIGKELNSKKEAARGDEIIRNMSRVLNEVANQLPDDKRREFTNIFIKLVTGYITYKENLRRVSPIVLSPVRLENKEYRIAILPFLSAEDFKDLVNDPKYKLTFIGWHHSNKGLRLEREELSNMKNQLDVVSIINNYVTNELCNEINNLCNQQTKQANKQK
ncbi:type III-B CRISPR module RAMP protein Cmr1 [Acidianus sulfidivorans JP7]|uniref:Type III-B CRISPR module RAMP protein Cmr1 n=1 Tax=Acidianus sulfidivorans JP7 TaxID=619593 RepID=A0A2U9IQ59_9CREN|nr:type III-B CRISPR module RAMP protein Cmr1 [Acidianus sulfidivorans]AWR98116.1 type III-B CRISPR module RAMP protein Cmr1 [Acidianus sulfidivorans JP7]